MRDRKEIEEKVIEVVTETLALESPARLEDSFREDLGADSIDIVTMMVSLQDELGDSFDLNDIQGRNSILDIVDFLEGVLLSDSIPA